MDSSHRSPLSDSDDSTPAVTGSEVQSPPASNPTGSPARSSPTSSLLSNRASAVRDEAVAESQVRSPATNNPLASPAPAVRDDAVTGSLVRSPPANDPTAPRTSAGREEVVTGSPLSSPSHHSPPKETTAAFVPRPRAWIIQDEPVMESAVRSPSPSAEKNQTAPPKDTTAVTGSPVQSPETDSPLASKGSTARDEVVTRSPVRSPPKEARAAVPRASSLSDEALTESPVRSPHCEEKKYKRQNSFYSVSSYQSPNRDVENPNASPQHKETACSSPVRGALTVGSLIRSPLGAETTEDPISLEKATPPTMPMASRMVARETTSTSKVGGRNGGASGLTKVEEGTLRQPAARKAADWA